jgi:exodeoxyribonuclease VII large subunit
VRASTPTDAAKLVVPDVGEQLALVTGLRDRTRRVLRQRIEGELRYLADLRGRPVLGDPGRDLDRRTTEVAALADRARRCATAALDAALADLTHATARVRALSPAATLDRGYAVVQDAAGAVVRDAAAVADGDPLAVRLGAGRLDVAVTAHP